VIDGRNRQRGCEIAGVVPTYAPIDKTVTDLTAYVALQNVKRRNLTAGQRAVAAARAWAVADAEGRILKPGETKRRPSSPQKGEHLIANPRVHFGKMFTAGKDQVEQAKALVDNDPVGVAAIMNGTTLAEAFRDYELRLGKDRNKVIRRHKLTTTRPDLIDKVDRDEMTLDAAEQQATNAANEEKQRRWALTMNLLDGAKAFDRTWRRQRKSRPTMTQLRLTDAANSFRLGGCERLQPLPRLLLGPWRRKSTKNGSNAKISASILCRIGCAFKALWQERSICGSTSRGPARGQRQRQTRRRARR
jgi:hypothetical protein